MINVTKTFLPKFGEYQKYLRKIWQTHHVTNHGPLVLELEDKLKKYFRVKHVFFVANGTIALQIAIKAAELQEEVITTPFSFVATTSSLVWENCQPVFADIEAETLTIDPAEIERKITAKTTGIVATHVYGNPCHIEKITKIAKKNDLKVIYDAAHAFGVKYKNHSLLSYGDISTISFHATKIFHTIEGGAVITNDDRLAKKISYLRNFGFKTPTSFQGLGINGKNCEFHAAMGLCLLPQMKSLIHQRKVICEKYDKLFGGLDIDKSVIRMGTQYNYSFYPIVLPSEKVLLKVVVALNKHGVFPRRYFYPSLNNLPYLKKVKMPISESVANRVLCLPLYVGLRDSELLLIHQVIRSCYV